MVDDMSTSANTFSQRLRNASMKTRASYGEPSPKRTRHSNSNEILASLNVKGPLQQSSEENAASFVAESFYGLLKSPLLATASKSSKEKLSDISEPTKEMTTRSYKAVPSMSRLDMLMMEKAKLSPLKQAVLQTCSLPEFKKMYKNEYKQLEEEMKRQNCRMTRQMSQTIRKEQEEKCLNSDSSDDEDPFELSKQGLTNKSGNQISPEIATDIVANSYQKSMSLNMNYTTPPRRIGHKVTLRNSMAGVNVKTGVTESTVNAKMNHRDILMDMNANAEESDKLSPNCKENSEVTNKDSSPKVLTTPSSSQRKFFKSRSTTDNSKRTSFDKGYKVQFVHKTLPIKDGRKKQDTQKRQPGSFSPKQKQTSTADKLQPASPISGFIFAPGFLSPEKRGSDNVEDESFGLNKSNRLTYGSPKETVHQFSTGQNLATSPTSCCSDDTNILTEDWHTDNHARKNVMAGNEQCSSNGDASHADTDKGSPQDSSQHKLFPIFGRKSSRFAASNKKQGNDNSPFQRTSKLPKDSDNSQMTIDAGQKRVGLTQCSVCSMVYVEADPADRQAHGNFHKKLVDTLNFSGWKKERVVQEYPEDLGRVILVLPDDAKYALKKVEEVNQLMGRELGFPDASSSPLHPYHKVFFYVVDKKITGCCVAESIQEGYRIILGDLDDSQESGQRPWCCSTVPESVCVGISRLWVSAENRKRGISTKLVDSVRQWYNYGSLIPKHKIAFSDPTPDGRRFAQKYMGTPAFLVYKFSYG